MTRVLLIAATSLLLPGALLTAIGAGFDGDAEHLKVTRKPVPMLAGIGAVDFRITCHHPHTQQYFNQGIALLHGGDLRLADQSFFHASKLEPSCAMVWLGLAFANEANRPLAKFYGQKASQLQDDVSDREKLWISALNAYLDTGTSDVDRRTFLVTALDRIVSQFPEDLEAGAFLVRQFLRNRDAGIPIPLTSAADFTIEHVLRQNSNHPAHHYKLLLWEQTQPERALVSAEQARRALPEAARIQSAAGRIYSVLNRQAEAFHCFESAMTIAGRQAERDHVCPLEIEGFVENAGWLIDNLALTGRVREAVALSRRLVEMPAPEPPTALITDGLPAVHAARVGGLAPIASEESNPAAVGQRKLLRILVEFQCWDELLALARGNYFESTDRELQCRKLRAVGLAHFGRLEADAITGQLEQLSQLRATLTEATFAPPRLILLAQVEAALRELRLCEAIARGGRPPLSENMANIPGPRVAAMFLASGDRATAEKLARETAARSQRADDGWNLVQVLKSTDQLAAADAALNELKLRFLRWDVDLARMTEPVTADAEADRPAPPQSPVALSLADWQPPAAPAFKLADRNDKPLSFDDYRGKRVVLVFYLGAGCPHCIEQLKTFAPLKEAYEQAGLTVIAISTDSVAGLQKTFQVTGAGDAIPFQLVSDESLAAFRAFGAFDERDNSPLHGTFLIDPRGRILWSNIRREPFMATRSLLDEARRVFALQTASSGGATHGLSAK